MICESDLEIRRIFHLVLLLKTLTTSYNLIILTLLITHTRIRFLSFGSVMSACRHAL